MPVLEVFFDFICPFCLKGHNYLLELLPQHPDLEVIWRPTEAHPRPERYGHHSDFCARSMYIAQELGVNVMAYHDMMYKAALTDNADIEQTDVILDVTAGFIDREYLEAVLSAGAYQDRLSENNRLAWDVYDFAAVPSYRLGDMTLASIPGVGVSKRQLEEFLRQKH